jgi:hypothetical protein
MLNWTIEYDDNDNPWYEAASAVGTPNEGPFHWRIKPEYIEGAILWKVRPDAELDPDYWNDANYTDPMQAAIEVESTERGIVSDAKAEWDALPQAERDRLTKEYS